ncbi:MaoC family dehydratase [Nocardioides daeguensis]|uniref:MaoC family dehydratase n=1 Tax=Nocardioides daeguensis TaxID=908359 RepID=A0ABP6W6U1_9ACTN|nr:MaoC family dehydratase [Nocardioides daeguensis]MBV6729806.1 MaoC family dehydratase [Nocardioides daeguensis]MCR1775377.1 MaoC family dehydratase [Nocardioides daeguensis]
MTTLLYLEDFPLGATWELGAYQVTETAIVEFGTQFDPQPFHTDVEAARGSSFGGLVASGWHTSAITTRILVDELYSRAASLGSPGVEEIRWTRPVRPGDSLSVRFTVTESRPSASKPDRGVVHCLVETLNQDGDVVMTLRGAMFFARRDR